jgi:hypothetical protein
LFLVAPSRHSSSVVEHSIRNRAVIGSIPICGSLNERCGCSSVGRAPASQAGCRGFEPLHPLWAVCTGKHRQNGETDSHRESVSFSLLAIQLPVCYELLPRSNRHSSICPTRVHAECLPALNVLADGRDRARVQRSDATKSPRFDIRTSPSGNVATISSRPPIAST